jgi:hypothetical protein
LEKMKTNDNPYYESLEIKPSKSEVMEEWA